MPQPSCRTLIIWRPRGKTETSVGALCGYTSKASSRWTLVRIQDYDPGSIHNNFSIMAKTSYLHFQPHISDLALTKLPLVHLTCAFPRDWTAKVDIPQRLFGPRVLVRSAASIISSTFITWSRSMSAELNVFDIRGCSRIIDDNVPSISV